MSGPLLFWAAIAWIGVVLVLASYPADSRLAWYVGIGVVATGVVKFVEHLRRSDE